MTCNEMAFVKMLKFKIVSYALELENIVQEMLRMPKAALSGLTY